MVENQVGIEQNDKFFSDEYDGIAKVYSDSRDMPSRKFVEMYSLRSMLDSLGFRAGESSFLDLGCGEGRFAREAVRHGAGLVVGVDISAELIALAREKAPGISFHVGSASVSDLARLNIGQYDFVYCGFLFSCTTSVDILNEFYSAIFASLKPGAHFIAIARNTASGVDFSLKLLEYGWASVLTGPVDTDYLPMHTYINVKPSDLTEDGELNVDDPEFKERCFKFQSHVVTIGTHATAAASVGLQNFRAVDCQVDPKFVEELHENFFDTWKKYNPLMIFTAQKPV